MSSIVELCSVRDVMPLYVVQLTVTFHTSRAARGRSKAPPGNASLRAESHLSACA